MNNNNHLCWMTQMGVNPDRIKDILNMVYNRVNRKKLRGYYLISDLTYLHELKLEGTINSKEHSILCVSIGLITSNQATQLVTQHGLSMN